MTKFASKSFSVAVGGKKYSDNWERIFNRKEKIEEGWCPVREDETHCVHWWDGDKPCCGCKEGEK